MIMNTTMLKFSKDHEWVRVEGNTAYIGISDFAQQALGDIVFVDLPQAGTKISAGGVFAAVESVKAVSEVFAPVSGAIIEVNEALNDAPELLNEKPYEAWIAKAEMENPGELAALMDAGAYEAFCKEGA
jgi:glycine cleavage system H protein